MLNSNNELTPYFAGSILSATHQEGKYPTQYSNIYDLKNGLIYLFYYHNYELVYSTTPDFSGYISTTEMDDKPDTPAHASLVYLAGFLLLSYLLIKEKKMHYSLIIIMFTMLFHFHCKKEEENNFSIVEVEEFTKTIADLSPGTTYYWKIIAHPGSGDDFYSETVVRYFKCLENL